MLIDCNFPSCGHLQQRLAVSLGALFFCLTEKMSGFVLSQSIYCLLPHQSHSSQRSYSWDTEISEYRYCQPSNIYFKFVSRIFLYSDWLLYWLLHWHLYIWNMCFFFQKQESLGIMQHILYRCSCFSEPITSIFVFCSPFALFQDY